MRKRALQVPKTVRIPKDLDDRLAQFIEESGVSQNNAFIKALETWLTVKGF